MQQTKELNAFFIHMVCSAVSLSCPRAQTVRALHSPGVSHPAHLSPGQAQGEKGQTSGSLEGIYAHYPWEFDFLKRERVEEQGRKAVVADGLRSLLGAVCVLWSDHPPWQNAHNSQKSWCAEGLSWSSWTTAMVTLLIIQTALDHTAWEAWFPTKVIMVITYS